MGNTVIYKNKQIYNNCHVVEWHEKLIEVVWWILDLTGEIVLTSGYRSNKIYSKDSGIHGTIPLRAIDLRHYIYTNPEKLRDHINLIWTYDPSRPHLTVAFLHDTGLGKHFHIQVHDKTTRI